MHKTFTLSQNHNRIINLDQSGHYTVKLAKEGAEATIKLNQWLKATDRLDIFLTIIHSAPNTQARTILKVVVDDAAYASLNGTIIVTKGAQKTNSFLEERILLLSDNARADAVPNLEIEADDVKCSHAAAIGKIDEAQLFYLKSRGIPESQAKTLIAQGFLR